MSDVLPGCMMFLLFIAVMAVHALTLPTHAEARAYAEQQARDYAEAAALPWDGVSCDSVGNCSVHHHGRTKPLWCSTPLSTWSPSVLLYGQPVGCREVVFAALGRGDVDEREGR